MDIIASQVAKQKRVTIFFCYAHEDEQLLNQLKNHLQPLRRQGLIELWYDREIRAGSEWEPEIKKRLDAAQIVLLLISPDFMASDYCYGIEMQRALERHQSGKAIVIPIILRDVFWHGEPLGKLQALPTDGRPVTSRTWGSRDEAFYSIIEGIKATVENSTGKDIFAIIKNDKSKFPVSDNSDQKIYNDITRKNPSIEDPLVDNTQGNEWLEGSWPENTSFYFSKKGYHMSVGSKTSEIVGLASFAQSLNNLHDFTRPLSGQKITHETFPPEHELRELVVCWFPPHRQASSEQ